ncbi:riboflavin synthase [Zhaonella formicivorans]|jgi:riboflavin synthase|uniref:riboflavin synthase n=1 Tax=Zhaonella formicivorans TaxID=2528593 RepID=UPI0010DCA08F|nr:riboflavin synthase [Zhaonella formicivorans]
MFTGIIEELGTVLEAKRLQSKNYLRIQASLVLEGTKLGDSIAVNGVCLTVVSLDKSSFTVDVMPETYRKTTLEKLSPGDKVNLERAMSAQGRFGGHFVSGHVDSTGEILTIAREENAVLLEIGAPPSTMRYIVEKGSIAVEGISLTVAKVDEKSFWLSLIPHTYALTNLQYKRKGSQLNLETDMLAKYIEKFTLLNREVQPKRKLTLSYLQELGF